MGIAATGGDQKPEDATEVFPMPLRRQPLFRVSCDSIVVMPPRTLGSWPIFAKNSDRPPDEAQPLVRVPAAEHRPGSKLRCQYIEIEQVARTHAFLGSRPHWLWGCEHGVNDQGVAVGNHTIYTKDALGESGLQGMDLVRLALERASSAREAAGVIGTLIERYGQGGSGFADMLWPYNNSFLLADPKEAYLLECSARHWALKRLPEGGSASNHTVIGADWDELSRDCIAHAVENGWWSQPDSVRFDFAAAYRDESVVPAIVSSGRYRTTCGALAEARGGFDLRAVERVMRDHYDHGETHLPGRTPDDERFFSVCMHAGPVGVTAASMVAELAPPADGQPQLVWVTLCNPCVSPYLPVFPQAPLPPEYTRGDRDPASGGAWWRFKRLLTAVESDFACHAGRVREAWRNFERDLVPAAADAGAAAARLEGPARERSLGRFMQEAWERASALLDRLTAEVEAG